MKYLSVFSGIEAASVAWKHLGWEPVGFSEIEPFPCAVLKHRFPNTPNYGDITKYAEWPIAPGSVNLLIGGSPCQAFSVAGLRQGLADPRGNLALVFLGLADRLKPRWIVWENVPGVLSSNKGRDFGAFLGALGQFGYGFAYRTLDTQFVGRCAMHSCFGDGHGALPQRRRRVFVVASLGGWERCQEALSFSEGMRWNPSKGGKKKKEITDETVDGIDESSPIAIQGTIIGRGVNAGPQGTGATEGGPMFTLTKTDIHAVCAYDNMIMENSRRDALRIYHGVSPTLQSFMGTGGGNVPLVKPNMSIRRLTVNECLRLQGFPDGWTDVPFNGKQANDSVQYKAIGNSMSTNVMRWIGENINRIESNAN